ncbi:YdbH domain-containing protein [Shewanella colwelliana]
MRQGFSNVTQRLMLITVLFFITVGIASSLLIANMSYLTQAVANRYLMPQGSQVTAITLSLSSLSHLRIDTLSLDVNDSQIHIDGLQLTLAKKPSWLDMGLKDIETIALGNISVALNPTLLNPQSAQDSSSGPTLSLDLNHLPQIAIGPTHFEVKEINTMDFSLDMDYLNLDDQGRVTSALSHQGQLLLAFEVSLNPNQWALNSTLSLERLQGLLNQIAQLPTVNPVGPLGPLIALKETVERHHLALTGDLATSATLDIATAQLTSTHQLSNLSMSVYKIAGTSLQTPLDLQPQSAHPQAEGPISFTLNGPITDLTLALQPLSLQLALSEEQYQGLLRPLDETGLHGLFQRIKDAQQATEFTRSSSLNIYLALQSPLLYRMANAQLTLGSAIAEVTLADFSLSAELTDSRYVHTHNSRHANSQWSLNLKQGAPLCLSALDSGQFNTQPTCNNQDDAFNLAQLKLATHGELIFTGGINNLGQPTSAMYALTIAPGSELKLQSPAYQRPNIEVTAQQISLQLTQATRLTVTESLTAEVGELLVILEGNQFEFGRPISPLGSDNRHGGSSSQSDFQSILTSHLSTMQFAGASLTMGLQGVEQLSILPMTMTTKSPHLLSRNALTPKDDSLRSDTVTFQSTNEFRFANRYRNQQPPQFSFPEMRVVASNTSIYRHTTNSENQPRETELQLDSASVHSQGFSLNSIKDDSDAQQAKHVITALLHQPGQTSLTYQLDNVTATEHYKKRNKQKNRKTLSLTGATLSQELSWRPANEQFRLSTTEQWQADTLQFNSAHQLTFSSKETVALLDGQLSFNSDINQLLTQSNIWFATQLPADLIGDMSITSDYQLRWQQSGLALAMKVTPKVEIGQGSINNFPLEQASFSGDCSLSSRDLLGNITRLGCDALQLKVAAFNPGVLLTDLEATTQISLEGSAFKANKGALAQSNYAVTPQIDYSPISPLRKAQIDIKAHANTLGGSVLLPKFNLNLNGGSEAYLVLQAIDLQALLAIQPQVGIYADGFFDGVLPVELTNGQVSIEGGRLAARAPGGLIKVENNPAVLQMRLSQPYLDFAFAALEELNYSELSSSFDMQSNGDAQLMVNVKGRAKDIERPIHLNYSQEENMLQLLQSLQIGDRLQTQIEEAMASQ